MNVFINGVPMKYLKMLLLLFISSISLCSFSQGANDDTLVNLALALQNIAQDSATASEEELEGRMTVLIMSNINMTTAQFLEAFSAKNADERNASEIAYDLYERTGCELCKKIGRCFRTELNIFEVYVNELNVGHLTIAETNSRDDLRDIILSRSEEMETK